MRSSHHFGVPKVARVAVLYDSGNPAGVREVKELLRVEARALKFTIQPWEVRDADGFERVFAALSKERSDGLSVLPSPLMRANGKRIVGFALKSRLPSVYNDREAVDARGLMSDGADLAESYRRRVFRGQNPEGEPSAPSCP